MIKAAVLGSPIAHSLSPKIHRRAYEFLGIAGSYDAIEVGEDELANFFESERSLEWSGFSLTMPLKEAVIKLNCEVSQIAKLCNSGNTLYRRESQWSVTSTDYLAFRNLVNLKGGEKVAVIGGGGTARAAIGALNEKVATVDVFLRNPKRQSALVAAAPDLQLKFLEMSTQLSGYDLIIQTTPAGAIDELLVTELEVTGKLLECLYMPWPTKFAERYLDAQLEVISGGQLLVEQAMFQVELFAHVKVDFEAMRPLLLAEITE
jgi:shikimate dehydrogenase